MFGLGCTLNCSEPAFWYCWFILLVNLDRNLDTLKDVWLTDWKLYFFFRFSNLYSAAFTYIHVDPLLGKYKCVSANTDVKSITWIVWCRLRIKTITIRLPFYFTPLTSKSEIFICRIYRVWYLNWSVRNAVAFFHFHVTRPFNIH